MKKKDVMEMILEVEVVGHGKKLSKKMLLKTAFPAHPILIHVIGMGV